MADRGRLMMLGGVWLPSLDGHAADTETLLMLYSMVRYLRPALVVEAGTYQGHATCVLGLAMRDGQIDGEVWSADVRDYGAAGSIAKNELGRWVHLFDGDFGAMLSGPLADRTFRMAFIDSGLVVGGTDPLIPDLRVGHARLARERLAPGGVMVIDDMASEWHGSNELRGMASCFYPNGRGMVIVQRPE